VVSLLRDIAGDYFADDASARGRSSCGDAAPSNIWLVAWLMRSERKHPDCIH